MNSFIKVNFLHYDIYFLSSSIFDKLLKKFKIEIEQLQLTSLVCIVIANKFLNRKPIDKQIILNNLKNTTI